MEHAVEYANVLAALKRVRQNKGSPGVDEVTVGELPQHLAANSYRYPDRVTPARARSCTAPSRRIREENGGHGWGMRLFDPQ